MDQETLFRFGFSINGGAIDRRNVCYGKLTVDGPVLNEAGIELLKKLQAEAAAEPVVADPSKPEVSAPTEQQPVVRRGKFGRPIYVK